MINPFYKSRLICKISQYIQNRRSELLEDLVKAVRDATLYEHQLQVMIHNHELTDTLNIITY